MKFVDQFISKVAVVIISSGLLSISAIVIAEPYQPLFDKNSEILTLPIVKTNENDWFKNVLLKLEISTNKLTLLSAEIYEPSDQVAWDSSNISTFNNVTNELKIPVVSINEEQWFHNIGLKLDFFSNSFLFSNIERIDNYEQSSWQELSPIPTGRRGSAIATLGRKIYVIGGLIDSQRVGMVEEYNSETNTWTNCGSPAPGNACASMPTNRSGASTSIIDGKIYVIGGRSAPTTFLSTVEAYDPITNSWVEKRSMPTKRSGLTTTVIKNKIYAIGGDWYKDKVEVYHPTTDTWSSKHPMPSPRESATASVAGNKIYLFGGYNDGYVDTVDEYNPLTDTWQEKSPMPTKRSPASSSRINGKIYVIGGTLSWPEPLSIVEEYDYITDSWAKKTALIYGRMETSSVVINNTIYVVGGSSSGISWELTNMESSAFTFSQKN